MPQLDLITFFPQFFWCFLCFICFFLYVSFYIIPNMTSILKFRKFKLISLAQEINKKKDVSTNLLVEHNKIVSISLKEIKQLINKLVQTSNLWVEVNIFKINTTTLLSVNKRILNSVSKKQITPSVICFYKRPIDRNFWRENRNFWHDS
jgi:hypothetical protein